MTICLAGIATEETEEYIVFATDHMVSTTMGSFEHPSTKYKILNDFTIAMLAGNPVIFDDLVKLEFSDASFENIKGEIFNNFKRKRKDTIQKEIFDIFGIDRDFFLSALANEIPNPFINTIIKSVAEARLECQILLIGFENDKAQLAEITDENMANFRDMNFHAIGSGIIQALNTMLFQKHDKRNSLMETIYNIYKAKRNAEVLEGVGKETELMILTKNGHFKIDETGTQILQKIYEDELEFGKKHKDLSQLKERIKDVIAITKKD